MLKPGKAHASETVLPQTQLQKSPMPMPMTQERCPTKLLLGATSEKRTCPVLELSAPHRKKNIAKSINIPDPLIHPQRSSPPRPQQRRPVSSYGQATETLLAFGRRRLSPTNKCIYIYIYIYVYLYCGPPLNNFLQTTGYPLTYFQSQKTIASLSRTKWPRTML